MQKLWKIPNRIGLWVWYLIAAAVLTVDIVVLIHNQIQEDKAKIDENYIPELIRTVSEWAWGSDDRGKVHHFFVIMTILVVAKHLAAPKFLRRLDPIGLVGLAVRLLTRRV